MTLFDTRTLLILAGLVALWYVVYKKPSLFEGLDEVVPPTMVATQEVPVAQPAVQAMPVVQEMSVAPVPMDIPAAAESPFTAEGADLDELFPQDDNVDPASLIPDDLPGDLYADYKADPSLAGNMLINAYQMGVETSSAKRNFVSDVRKIYAIPQKVVSPWLNSDRTPPDSARRSLSDIE